MRIGIIGTGRIAGRFVAECREVEGVQVSAVYNPHAGSAESFVKWLWDDEKERPAALDNIEGLWGAVDAVYIASPHETHFNYIISALEQGKHVLCEKPMTLTKDEACRAFSAAKKLGPVLMEGLKTVYCPGYKKLLEVVRSGMIGEIKYIESRFTKLEKPGVRELTDRQYGGSFRELGSYVCLPVMDILGMDSRNVRFSRIDSEAGIDVFTKIDFVYDRGLASAICGLGVKTEGSLLISGTLGYIKADAPWWKTSHFEVHFEDVTKIEMFDEEFLGDGLRYEIEEFKRRIEGTGAGPDKSEEDRIVAMGRLMEEFGKIK